jgi:hypothetical protein
VVESALAVGQRVWALFPWRELGGDRRTGWDVEEATVVNADAVTACVARRGGAWDRLAFVPRGRVFTGRPAAEAERARRGADIGEGG